MINNPSLFADICKKAGTGFISGQGIAATVSLYHALFKAPSGKELDDFIHHFKRNSRLDGVAMATWSILNTLIEPMIEDKIQSKQMQSIVSGALSSAVMSIRNGSVDVMKNAVSGAAQSLALNILGAGVEVALKPLDLVMMKNVDSKFFADRAEAVFRPPTEAISDVFLK
ncbi:hypothetical protein TRFO_18217 [Tritrichomonas foetus]|uniref:Uncharacterized protein n=1 Tax=Tritrichomonas foetus TaxID=1144522 RepID=A0A1J4KM70_9EUKA|nr:hypothetical protein TRFO_18217 [Tritrichomonas foetus]|eukprot:OHT12032.1 hypothetical protein TRFO_18217 [Tritrichomonas foetus]